MFLFHFWFEIQFFQIVTLFHQLLCFSIWEIWKIANVCFCSNVHYEFECQNLRRTCTLTHCEKKTKYEVLLPSAPFNHTQRTRKCARAAIKCFQMDIPDHLDSFCRLKPQLLFQKSTRLWSKFAKWYWAFSPVSLVIFNYKKVTYIKFIN